jgi:hypothetical protein
MTRKGRKSPPVMPKEIQTIQGCRDEMVLLYRHWDGLAKTCDRFGAVTQAITIRACLKDLDEKLWTMGEPIREWLGKNT